MVDDEEKDEEEESASNSLTDDDARHEEVEDLGQCGQGNEEATVFIATRAPLG